MLHSVKTRLFAAALCGAMLLTTACGGSAAGGTGSAAASGAGDASAASSGTAETGETGGPKYGGTLTDNPIELFQPFFTCSPKVKSLPLV